MSQRFRLQGFCAVVLAAILAPASGFAGAYDPLPPAGAGEANQVLEIPQQCSQAAVAVLCDRSDAGPATNTDTPSARASDSSGSADIDASADPEYYGASTYGTGENAAANDDSGAVPDNPADAASPGDTANGAYGSIYDYQNQYSSQAPAGAQVYVIPMPAFVPAVPIAPGMPMMPAYSYVPRYFNPPVYAPAYSYSRTRRPGLWRRYWPAHAFMRPRHNRAGWGRR